MPFLMLYSSCLESQVPLHELIIIIFLLPVLNGNLCFMAWRKEKKKTTQKTNIQCYSCRYQP